ncbi:hypothetical protein D805_0936 [Bifidobacterium thermophilum RBL67]|uniref:Uncharacterized protein n=1 Tax=Bifidobacterium thermophilum RBL67 TaxID=1254439 RepID=M4RF67_9BIFI|nr:hypothetical protein D805_0936 [Bifidobacterium thermophilum RBL67]
MRCHVSSVVRRLACSRVPTGIGFAEGAVCAGADVAGGATGALGAASRACFRRRSHGAWCVTSSSAEDCHTLRTGGGRRRGRMSAGSRWHRWFSQKRGERKNTLFS